MALPENGKKISAWNAGTVDQNSYFLQAKSGATEKVSVDEIADYVGTSATFSRLETESKTPVGAINEVNRKVDRGGVQLTQSEYDALVNAGTVDANTTYFITDGQNITTASAVTYDNTNSGMTATNVQGAIDEINTTMSPLFYLGSYTYTAASVAAGENINISRTNFSITDVTGYTPLAVRKIGVSKAGFNITSFNASGVSSVLSVRNDTSAAIANTTFTITIIYVKSNFLQNLS